jgi:polar amino acid transport system substrate-binding protein
MRLLRLKILVFILVFLFILPATSLARTLRVALDRDYPPFTYIDKDGNLVGISVDFWELFEEKTGIDVELIPVEWAKAHQMMLERSADVIDSIFKTPAREEYFDFTSAIFRITSSIYYRSGLENILSPKDLTPYVVGAKEKDALIDFALAQNGNITFRLYKNYSDIVESAKKGEIDVFIMDDLPANFYLVKYDLLYKFRKTEPFTVNYIYIATQDGNKEILDILNSGLTKFSQEELDNLLKKYTVTVEEERYPPWLPRAIAFGILGVIVVIHVLFVLNRFLAKKIEIATRELLASKEELMAMNEELRANNEELEELYKQLEESTGLIWKILETVSKISMLNIDEEEFLEDILKLALETIPKTNAGSIFIIDKNSEDIRLVKTIGHGKELEGLVFKKDWFIASDDAIIVKDLLDRDKRSNLPLELYEILVRFSKPAPETIIAPLNWQDRRFGYVNFDIINDKNTHFNETDLNIAGWFGSVVASFYAIRNYVRKEGIILNNLVITLTKALEYYDKYTCGHSERVARYALEIAERLNLDLETAKKIYWAGYLHDIGKIFVPQDVLNKPGRFTEEEYNIVKIHPVKSEELVSEIEELREIARIIRHHHERWDGKGYPDGLSGEDIPLSSRILGIADAFEAMTCERPYKRGLTLEEAIEELKRCSGTQFDPKLVDVMVSIIEEELRSKGT